MARNKQAEGNDLTFWAFCASCGREPQEGWLQFQKC